MGLDYAFRFSAREPDEDGVSADDIVRAYGAMAPGAASIDDVPEALRQVIRRSLAVAALADIPDPVQALHRHFCDNWGRAWWLHDSRLERELESRGIGTFMDLVPGPADRWHSASAAKHVTVTVMTILNEQPHLTSYLDKDLTGLQCLEHMFARLEAARRDVQFLVLR